MNRLWIGFGLLLIPQLASASNATHDAPLVLTHSTIGYASLILFCFAYALVMLEEYLQLRKSKPVLLAAGLIWAMIGYAYQQHGNVDIARAALEHNLLEYEIGRAHV